MRLYSFIIAASFSICPENTKMSASFTTALRASIPSSAIATKKVFTFLKAKYEAIFFVDNPYESAYITAAVSTFLADFLSKLCQLLYIAFVSILRIDWLMPLLAIAKPYRQ